MNNFRLLIWACLVIAAAGPALAADVALQERHQSSGKNSGFGLNGSSFSEYIKYSREVIGAARVDLSGTDRARIIDGNSPFELKPANACPTGKAKPYRRGILLTHGLTDSPYFMRALASVFQENCFRVMAIVLPGHGTRPGDLLEVTWQEWAKAEAFGVDALAKEVDEIYLSGFSTGGALSIHQSIIDPRIKGLFLFAPAIRISALGIMANWHEAYSWFMPKAKWIDIAADVDPYKYESFPANAADQIHLLTQQVQADLRQQKRFMLPVFVVASTDDASVVTAETLEFFKYAIHPLNTFMLYDARATALPPEISSDKVTIVKSALPDRRILSSAHTALVLPPEDPHYGAQGDYASCLHYFPKAAEKFRQCKEKKEDYLGEVTDDNLKKGVIRRLTYNFNFDGMKAALKRFIQSLPDSAS